MIRILFLLSSLFICGLGLAVPAQDVPHLKYEGSWNSLQVLGGLDYSAILRTWRIKGVLVCVRDGRPHACLWIENAYPCGIFEVVRQPFRTHMKEGQAAAAVLKKLPIDLQSSHGGDLQFADVRVWTFVPDLLQDLGLPIAVPRATLLEFNYVSELDFLAWRSDWIDLLMRPDALLASCERLPDPKRCAGVWGSYAPRTGFVARSNEVTASYLQALRGGRAASRPSGRVVLRPYRFEPRTGHFIQMLSPSRRLAVSIGSPRIAAIERDALSKNGAYLFAHFGMFEVCRGCMPVRLAGERMPR